MGNISSNSYVEYWNNDDRTKTLSIKEYLNEIKPYLKEIINNIKKSDTLKIQLTIAINLISSEDTDKNRIMDSKNDNVEIMTCDKAHEAIEKRFESLLFRYQIGLKTSIKVVISSSIASVYCTANIIK